MRPGFPIGLAAVCAAAVLSAGCTDELQPAVTTSPILPDDGSNDDIPGDDDGYLETSLPIRPQDTPLPNPDAGGGGAPEPVTGTSVAGGDDAP
jgi:hypothetical protein